LIIEKQRGRREESGEKRDELGKLLARFLVGEKEMKKRRGFLVGLALAVGLLIALALVGVALAASSPQEVQPSYVLMDGEEKIASVWVIPGVGGFVNGEVEQFCLCAACGDCECEDGTPTPPPECPYWVCHKPGTAAEQDYCCYSESCVAAHLKHGDYEGRCQ
jgi:hypothetical protein